METNKFIRKSFEIDAAQVTAENMEEVAAWCSGGIEQETGGPKFIRVKVNTPLNPRQTQAFVGDWVLGSPRGYKVYTDNAFRNNFLAVPKEEEIVVKPDLEDILQHRLETATVEEKSIDDIVREKVEEALSNRIGNIFDFHLQPTNAPVVTEKDAINGKR